MTSFEYVPVPTDRLSEVYALLARPAAAVQNTEAVGDDRAGAASSTPATPAAFWMNEANIKRHLRPRSDTVHRFLQFLADRPNQSVHADEAAAALNLPHGWMSLAGANGALGVYLQNRGL